MAPTEPIPLKLLYNWPLFLINFPGASTVPANKDPIIIASAPAARAFTKSPENFIPPSEIIFTFLFFTPFLASIIALSWGTPIPPTKIVVQCQNERSQHKNKETCLNMLKARLYNYELKKREDQTKNIEDTKPDIGWGHQIRSYVLHPYRMVKDNRTNYESSNPDKVLDGDLDEFLESNLYNLNV